MDEIEIEESELLYLHSGNQYIIVIRNFFNFNIASIKYTIQYSYNLQIFILFYCKKKKNVNY